MGLHDVSFSGLLGCVETAHETGIALDITGSGFLVFFQTYSDRYTIQIDGGDIIEQYASFNAVKFMLLRFNQSLKVYGDTPDRYLYILD